MRVCPQEKFILTCDRDEKVRVTNYPSFYNIQTFLLGHREFVNCCAFVDQNHVLTGSGDSTIRLWQFIDGKELFCFDLNDCLGDEMKSNELKSIEDDEKQNKNQNNKNGDQESVSRSRKKIEHKLAIKNIFFDVESDQLVITFFNLPKLVLFSLEREKLILKFKQILTIESNVLDAIQTKKLIHLLTVNDGLISYEFKINKFTKLPNHPIHSINDLKEFFVFNEEEMVDEHLKNLFKFKNAIETDDGDLVENQKRMKV